MTDRKFTSRHSGVGGYKNDKIWIADDVPKDMRKRIRAHEEAELKARKSGMSYNEAHKEGLKAEHKGLSKKGIARHEGRVSSILRNRKR